MTQNVFVYGSLMSGLGNHGWLNGTPLTGATSTKPGFTMVTLGAFPGVVEHGNGIVKGELYDVDAITMQMLDQLESNGSFYTRKQVVLECKTTAWIYLLDESYLGRSGVVNGCWRTYLGKSGRVRFSLLWDEE